MRLEGKGALITGGASGIGRAIAERFAREGARVLAADNVEAGADVARAIEAAGGKAQFFRADISDSAQVRRMVDAALEFCGNIDILCNAAGVLYYGTILETTETVWARVMSVNLTGTFLCCRAVLPHMIERGRGSIINLASTTGAHDACAHAAAYVTSKGGVMLLTRAMAIDHARAGIRVNALCPGPTDTPMLRQAMTPGQLEAFAQSYPIGRLGRPEELANGALFLASDEASFVTGTAFYMDGGQTAEV
jgi:NAD(P)-dependent dehydrogenase (short-subunit alcohol dehydrogenase family)